MTLSVIGMARELLKLKQGVAMSTWCCFLLYLVGKSSASGLITRILPDVIYCNIKWKTQVDRRLVDNNTLLSLGEWLNMWHASQAIDAVF
jgi:hypothetical protein